MIGSLLLFLACVPVSGPETMAGAAPEPGLRGAEVRYRPGDPPDADGEWLLAAVPGASWDRGLAAAAADLLSLASDRRAVLDPASTLGAAARAGYPGQARFSRALTGGARPERSVDELVAALPGDVPVDVGLAVRRYGDGTALWVIGWAPRRLDMDPLPRDLALDTPLALRVDLPPGESATPRLYLVPPGGAVERLSLSSGVSRWVDRFQAPGQYRLSVTLEEGGRMDVALLFSIFVDGAPPPGRPLRPPADRPPDPVAAEPWLLSAVNALREEHGLGPVRRFALFEPLAREHSALMALEGRATHTLADGAEVASAASALAHPRAEHHEAVLAAASAEDALALLAGSPAHLAVVLCEPCTHASVGAALEPVLDRAPRLFVTLELLSFPNGEPAPIDRYDR